MVRRPLRSRPRRLFQRDPSRRSGRKVWSEYTRVDGLRIFFIIVGAFIIIRLGMVQIFQNNYYEALAFDAHKLYQELVPERGDMFVKDQYAENGRYAIASNKTLAEVHAEPVRILDPQKTAEALAPLLNIPQEDLLVKLDKPNDPDEVLKRRVPAEVVQAIQDLNMPGITFWQEQWRYYPEGEITAHVTGYYGYSDEDRKGQYGLEGYFNEQLSGLPGYLRGEKDAVGRFLTMGDSFIEDAVDGTDLELTIDKNVQFFACEKLKAAVEKYAAKNGTVIIMNPHTGAVLAMCNMPSYDPNRYNEVESIDVFTNQAVTTEYEPGSVFKAFTMAAGLDLGKISPDSTYVDNGQVKIDKYTIRNSDGKAHGTQTMTEVLEKSLNTGSIYVAQQIGNEAMYQYVEKFGFGIPTEIELAGERSGDISELAKLRDVYSATASYGQGLTVTPIQLITAYAAIANGGQLMKPYVVEKQILPDGTELETQPQVVRQVISEHTARILSAMLVNVIDFGHAKTAKVSGYFMAGKTGTAQVVGANGTYDAHRHNDTFVGFGPTSDPQFIMLVRFEEPANVQWADSSAAPLWGEIAKYLVQYYHIPPDRTE